MKSIRLTTYKISILEFIQGLLVSSYNKTEEVLQEDRKKLYYMKRRKMIQHRQKEIIVVTKGEIS